MVALLADRDNRDFLTGSSVGIRADLYHGFHSQRQNSITEELLDIVYGSEAVKPEGRERG